MNGEMGQLMILLGCGDENRDGWVHVDLIQHGDHVDVVHDLNVIPWPFDDDSAQRIEANDVLEHLDDVVTFFDECWRVLAPGGILRVQTVRYTSENAWRDPTHRRPFHPDVFKYFDPAFVWWQQYGKFYTERSWRVIWVQDEDNIKAELTPRKGSDEDQICGIEGQAATGP